MQAQVGLGQGGAGDLPRPEPVTRKEEALWLLERLVPGAAVNNLSFTFQVRGRLDRSALQEAMTLLVRRHEVLRTVFHAAGAGLAKQVRPAAESSVEVLSIPQGADGAPQLTEFVAAPFAFDGRPLVRLGHLAGDDADVVCLVVHHLVFDTISAGTLLAELVAAYTALAEGRAPDPELLKSVPALTESPPRADSLAYWQRQLSGFDPGGLALAYGKQEAAGATLAGDQITVPLSDAARAVVQELRKRLNTSEAVVLLATYYLLLAQHGGGPDLAVGTMVNVRSRTAPNAVGYHVNVVPLRLPVDLTKGFADLVERTGTVFFDGIAHADVPVDSLYNEVARDGAAWRNSLFRHVFNYVPGLGLPDFEIAGLGASPLVVEVPFSKFDLEFFVMSTAEELRLRAVYSTDVFTRDDVDALLGRYEALLLSLGSDLDRPLSAITGWSERDRAVIATANRTAPERQHDPVPDAVPDSVLEAVRATVDRTPEAVAVDGADGPVTYRQLWDEARTVANALRGRGTVPGDVVALLVPRGAALASAVLGVWLAGAGYLPLDPDHPAHRIAYQLADSGARAVLAQDGLKVPAPEGVPVLRIGELGGAPTPDAVDGTDPGVPPDPADSAYLIYTSGSTGRPKGTLVSHGSLANLVGHFADELKARAGESTLWLTTFSFDISALELFLPLATGGRLVIAPDAARSDGRVLARLLGAYDVDIVQATPTTWRLVVEDCGSALSGRRVLCGGEPLPSVLAHRLADTGCELRNVYGPTETTIWSTSGVVRRDTVGQVDVGRPIRDTRVFIAAADGRELPVGVRGELCIAGGGVALGYHNRPELTADRFRVHPVHGRYYRTGDLAAWRADGTLEVLGRVDRQVKLRGNRIELGEVESVLLDHPEVRAAAAVVVGDGGADASLVAFLVATDAPGLVNRLWEHARTKLPAPAVPGEFVVVDALPTTGNHKVDYLALARQVRDRIAEREERAGQEEGEAAVPDDELVATLVELWQTVLDRTDLLPDSNFFTSGGHSLLAAQLTQRIEERLGVRLQLAEVFTRPTPVQLAGFLRSGGE
ncbi:non-ribosomal peptide synthetase [Streptomyces sp. MMG1121]|uniref:non-ribosomal peptide synthetase n=1 Tax=Streptomyces sp. MMG1121 TaxID=1415544 RepID=UPI0006ADA7C1|nr:non-ribosomal peptide synthetase [Streptomyces sp. MMG1121]KOV61143.1 hypothetical protein ADK64_28525 [Streptomyces sp. MMG1121]